MNGSKVYTEAAVTAFRRKQLMGIGGAIPGFLVVIWVLEHPRVLFPTLLIPAGDPSSRLAFVVQWMLVPGLCLLLGVIVAARRGFVPEAIDGTRSPASHSLEINLRFNQNTVEQTVLACIAWAGVALRAPAENLILIPAMAALFCMGRVTFWAGYLIHPMARAFGMVVTVVPTVGAFGWLLSRAWALR